MKIIEIIVDSLFPPRENELLVRGVDERFLGSFYQPQNISGCICLSVYKNSTVSALITENKFYNNTLAAKLLSILLVKWINNQSSRLVFVPVPLGQKRRRERGYNQVAEVLKYLKENDKLKVRQDLCSRTRETPAQLSLKRAERLTNVTGAFKANSNELTKLHDVTLVIVDDVHTTGSTMAAVRAVLAPNLDSSCKIICVALTH